MVPPSLAVREVDTLLVTGTLHVVHGSYGVVRPTDEVLALMAAGKG